MGYLDNVLNYSPRSDYRTVYSFETPTMPIKIDVNNIEEVSKLKLSRYFEIKNNKPIEIMVYGKDSVMDQKLKRCITVKKLKEEYNILLTRCLKAEKYINNTDFEGKEKQLKNAITGFDKLSNELNDLYNRFILEGIFQKDREKLLEVL
jgi:hypothetical protein